MSFLFNKTPVLTNNETIKDIFYAFPIGVIIIDKETYFSSSARILFANSYSRKILGIPKDNDMSLFMTKLNTFKDYDQQEKEDLTLREVIFHSKQKTITKVFISPTKELIHVKIKRHHQKILVTIDDLQEDRKNLLRKFVKSIGYEYLLTLYHEINNPLNSLIASVHEIIQKVESVSVISKRIDLLACLIQFFLKNFISYFQVSIIDKNEQQSNTTFNLDSIFKKISRKFSMLFEYKKIKYRNSNFGFLNNKSTTMNYTYFKTLIKTIFTYFYHKVDKGGYFSISVEKIDNAKAKLIFSNAKKSESLTRSFSSLSDHDRNKDSSKQKNTIQTIEMMITIMNKLSELLNLQLEYSDSDITWISLTIPYESQSKLLNEDEINECSPSHHNVFNQLNRTIPKFSLEDLNNFQPTPNMFNDDRNNVKRHTFKPFENLIKSKKKDLIKSLLKNTDMYNDNCCNENENNETHRDTQSMQDYHNLHLFDSSNDCSSISNDSDYKKGNKGNTTTIQESHSYIGKNKEFESFKRKNPFLYTTTNFEIISQKNKHAQNSISFKCVPIPIKNNSVNTTYRIIESNNEDLDNFSNDHNERNIFRSVKSSILNDRPKLNMPIKSQGTCKVNDKKDASNDSLRCSIAHIRHITEEDFENESKSSNMSFSRMTFQNTRTERRLYPPNKKTHTVPRQGFFNEEGTSQDSLFNHYWLLNNSNSNDCTPTMKKPALSQSQFPYQCQCKCCDVLVVDDEQFNLSCLTNLLRKLNIDCDIATNGKECLDQISRKSKRKCKCSKANYKLILLDILMPKVNGIEAAKEIIQRVSSGILPHTLSIIFISACLDQESVVKELNKEIPIVKDFISKPVKRKKIEDLIHKYYNND